MNIKQIKQSVALTLTFVILFGWFPILRGQEAPSLFRQYQETEGDKTTIHNFAIEKTAEGYRIQLESKSGKQVVTQQFRLDSGFGTLWWSYDAPFKNTKVTATRQQEKITMTGIDEGDTIEKTFKINDLPWNQTFNIGLEPFALSKEKSMKFWAIGTQGPGNMKITKFKVKKKDIETITLPHPIGAVKAQHLTISLTGLLSLFWTGKYWYRASDGVFLRYKGKNRASGPIATMELREERENNQ